MRLTKQRTLNVLSRLAEYAGEVTDQTNKIINQIIELSEQINRPDNLQESEEIERLFLHLFDNIRQLSSKANHVEYAYWEEMIRGLVTKKVELSGELISNN